MKQSTIMIIGAGIIGKATGFGLMKKGHKVIFIDKRPSIVKTLNNQGQSAYCPNYWKNFDINADVAMICVDTPLGNFIGGTVNHRTNTDTQKKINDSKLGFDTNRPFNGAADLSSIISSVSTHARWMLEKNNKESYSYHLVVIRSTVPPGTTERIVLPILEKLSRLKVGKHFGICMQPEFLRSATAGHDFLHPKLIVIGEYDRRSGDLLRNVYSKFGGRKIRVNICMAEFMKYVHNCFNATKISFSNEMWLLGNKLGIDSNTALQLAVRSAEGFWNPYYGLRGGRPYDGHCLPKDTQGFLYFAQNNNIEMPLLSAVVNLNKYIGEVVEPSVLLSGNSRAGKAKQSAIISTLKHRGVRQ